MIRRLILLPDTGSLGFGSNKSRHSLRFYSRTGMALLTVRCMDRGGGGGGGGREYHLADQKLQQLLRLSSRFGPSLTGLVVCTGQECVATA